MLDDAYHAEAVKEWLEARSKALWTQLAAYVQRKDVSLKDFEIVSKELGLLNPRYKGRHEIPLSQIVGSVGRYKDFIAHFLPVTRKMEDRWAHIASVYLDPVSGGVPPIEVYKVGSNYFVKDGNHRVSVANQLEMPTIEAYVWEYPIPTGLDANADIDTLLLEAEKRDFLEATHLDELRPQHGIELTLPGGYRELLHQISGYRDILSHIDGVPVSYEDAVTGWYDMRYEPSIQIIKRQGIMDSFPNRTPADLFIWVHREHMRLEEVYGHGVRLSQAVKAVEARHASPLRRAWAWLKKRVR